MTPATDQHRPPQAKPAAGSSGGRRPLLDLFPPRASGTSSARSAEQQPAAEPAAAQSTVIGDGLTYEPFYGLAEKAFSLAPDPKFLYYSASHGHAAQEILSAIRRREGIAVLTGESGSGKTTLCHALIDQLDRRTLTAMVSDPFVGIEALLKTLLIQFGVASWDEFARGRLAQATRNDLATALREFLKSLAALQAVALVVIDEAQEMSVEMFDHLRIISADPESSDRLQLLLVGQPELRDLIARRELRDLAQRVVVRCELEPLADDEIAGYVQRRLSVAASAKPNLAVTADAIKALGKFSGGLPREINRLCDRALALGYEALVTVIDEPLVRRAASDVHIERPSSAISSFARSAMLALVFAALVLAGAGVAVAVFHDRAAQVVEQWRGTPAAPRHPLLPATPPLHPLTPPR